MVYVISILLFAIGVLFVGYPLFRSQTETSETDLYQLHLQAKKSGSSPSMLEELELDFLTGTISEEEYRELYAKHKAGLKQTDNQQD